MNSLTLDPKDPAVAEAVKDCKVGDEKTLTVTGTVSKVGGMVVLDVTSAAYEEPEEEVEEETEVVVPVKKKGNPAMALVMGEK